MDLRAASKICNSFSPEAYNGVKSLEGASRIGAVPFQDHTRDRPWVRLPREKRRGAKGVESLMMQLQPRTGTSLGFSERTERVLAYLIPVLSGLFFLTVEKNRAVRRHAWQSLMVFVPIFVIYLILGFLGGVFGHIWGVGWLFGGLFGLFATLVQWIGIALWVLLMLVAFVSDAVFIQPKKRSSY